MASLTCELVWVKQLLQELKFCEIKAMKMYCYNQVALHIASNPVFHKRTKHIKLAAILFEKCCCQKKFVWSLLDQMISL